MKLKPNFKYSYNNDIDTPNVCLHQIYKKVSMKPLYCHFKGDKVFDNRNETYFLKEKSFFTDRFKTGKKNSVYWIYRRNGKI